MPIVSHIRGRALETVKTVLIVDDEEGIAELAARILAEYGFGALKAYSGEEAVGIFLTRGGAIDLTIMDMGMPGMGGLEAMSEILKAFPEAKIVVSSGSSEEDVAAALGCGAYATLGKPYRMNALVECVRGAVYGAK